MQSLEYNVEIARDLSLALFLANKNFPDIIITELDMLGGDGLEFLKELSFDDELRTIPVLFLVDTDNSAPILSQAKELGATRVLPVPDSIDKLFLEMMPFLNLENNKNKTRPETTPE